MSTKKPVRRLKQRGTRHLADRMADQMLANGLPRPEREHRFHPHRRWKFDFAWPQHKLAVEVEGGQFLPKARHTSAMGYQKDSEKYNEAALFGWTVIRVTTKMVETPDAIREIVRAWGVVVDGADPAWSYPVERRTIRGT